MAKKKVVKRRKPAVKKYAPSYAYATRPMWQWVLLYVVVGGIVYAAIYYLLLAPQGGYGY